MIKAFILYFLNIKPTHGYEIQKFIQLNEMNKWTKIQSGSIYYALSKLEKEGCIELYKEEFVGKKPRKIYQITPKGRETLNSLLLKEFTQPLFQVYSDKFALFPFLKNLQKDQLVKSIHQHIRGLQLKCEQIEKWQDSKLTDDSLLVEKMSFEIMLSNLHNQIKWHESLISELDQCMEFSHRIADVIAQLDFTEIQSLRADQFK